MLINFDDVCELRNVCFFGSRADIASLQEKYFAADFISGSDPCTAFYEDIFLHLDFEAAEEQRGLYWCGEIIRDDINPHVPYSGIVVSFPESAKVHLLDGEITACHKFSFDGAEDFSAVNQILSLILGFDIEDADCFPGDNYYVGPDADLSLSLSFENPVIGKLLSCFNYHPARDNGNISIRREWTAVYDRGEYIGLFFFDDLRHAAANVFVALLWSGSFDKGFAQLFALCMPLVLRSFTKLDYDMHYPGNLLPAARFSGALNNLI